MTRGIDAMRMSDLSRASGVPIPTVKYYLREGLLPAGERTSANQARYDDSHLRRLRLIRVLVEVGGLTIAAVYDVLAALDSDARVHDLLGAVQYALVASQPRSEPAWLTARADVDAYLISLGWRVRLDSPARDRLTDVLHGLRGLMGDDVPAEVFDVYAAVARQLAQFEVDGLPDADTPREDLAMQVTVGIAVFESALTALRLLAQEDASSRRFASAAAPATPATPTAPATPSAPTAAAPATPTPAAPSTPTPAAAAAAPGPDADEPHRFSSEA